VASSLGRAPPRIDGGARLKLDPPYLFEFSEIVR
jgi:hypothetical protein